MAGVLFGVADLALDQPRIETPRYSIFLIMEIPAWLPPTGEIFSNQPQRRF